MMRRTCASARPPPVSMPLSASKPAELLITRCAHKYSPRHAQVSRKVGWWQRYVAQGVCRCLLTRQPAFQANIGVASCRQRALRRVGGEADRSTDLAAASHAIVFLSNPAMLRGRELRGRCNCVPISPGCHHVSVECRLLCTGWPSCEPATTTPTASACSATASRRITMEVECHTSTHTSFSPCGPLGCSALRARTRQRGGALHRRQPGRNAAEHSAVAGEASPCVRKGCARPCLQRRQLRGGAAVVDRNRRAASALPTAPPCQLCTARGGSGARARRDRYRRWDRA